MYHTDLTAPELLNRLFIVNEYDRPYKDLIAVLGNDGLLRYLYSDQPAMVRGRDATKLTTFGFDATKIQPREHSPADNKMLLLYQSRPSTATYTDQKAYTRAWQGDDNHFLVPIEKITKLITLEPSKNQTLDVAIDTNELLRDWARQDREDDDVSIDDEREIIYEDNGAQVPAWVFVPRSVYDPQT